MSAVPVFAMRSHAPIVIAPNAGRAVKRTGVRPSPKAAADRK